MKPIHKLDIIILIIAVLLLVCAIRSAPAGEDNVTLPGIENYDIAVWEPVPTTAIQICNPESVCANIDFAGDMITYSGELEVDESAKLFFLAVFHNFKDCCEALGE